MPGYYDGESVSGRVGIRLKDGRKFQHDGIRIELIGNIELFYDKKNHYEFVSSFPGVAVFGRAAPGSII
uniref:Uncharacterized protein n=1 Tax=Cryptococcus bacillisporus CA1280 TaxID=1296109 RepID=A0A0D0VI91_CRYGA|nr:hypothetical protein I312_03425 [Cryptococcus bacillisporus CA1280]